MQPVNITYKGYLITTDKCLMQPEAIHKWLSEESYWSRNISYEKVKTAFDHSFCIGVLKDGQQVGFARLITDYASFAYLADVYVEDVHRGHGLSKKVMEVILELDWVKGLRRIMLATLDAHGLYSRFGFVEPAVPQRYMEINRAVYTEQQAENNNK